MDFTNGIYKGIHYKWELNKTYDNRIKMDNFRPICHCGAEITTKRQHNHISYGKEKLFCVIAYLPKATVQSAKASIPLQMGVVGGEIMQAIAILSVLITAPIGAIGINLTCEKLLHTEDKYTKNIEEKLTY